MDEDNPDYLVHEIFTQSFWKDHPLGKPILGTKETVKRFEQPVVSEFYGQRFYPGNMIIAAAGNLKHKQFLDMIREHFEPMKPARMAMLVLRRRSCRALPCATRRPWNRCNSVWVCGVSIAHEKRFVCYVLNTVLGAA